MWLYFWSNSAWEDWNLLFVDVECFVVGWLSSEEGGGVEVFEAVGWGEGGDVAHGFGLEGVICGRGFCCCIRCEAFGIRWFC
jgi:hypothetical protein